ncbi:Na+/H+ antiporter NhaA [Pseudoblastomonas halimionae]|uniref:Na(+)/H(+) antiporter NhaA n=1 Tax=Alteriqipengyuania halimionae TaxID=1926630 RepID=A0A6I4U0L2_9SPHN|nr:Na+/H+ antiporter NhaA [Alteriqipengyuania halimionae]MXP08764.1 Na+/H+ antiporter NhaA [Alteriqipengyuania halimionae]
MAETQSIGGALKRALDRFTSMEAAAGIVLIAVAIAALVAANSPFAHEYHELFHGKLAWTPIEKLDTFHLWINDGLMAIFFFVVGLEIKRELIDGQLDDAQKRRLPFLAAAAGMAVPALIYLGLVGDDRTLHSGWAIPAATDIAFAVGVLGLLGKRAPSSLRLFLLTVAIVDDLGAVAIIALVYTSGIKLAWLAAAAVILGMLMALNRFGVYRMLPYIVLSVALWFTVLNSGVHATVAGVLAAFTIPLKLKGHDDSMLLRMEHATAPWNGFMIVPIFGFANAGVALSGMGMDEVFGPLPLAIAAGLFFGKQIGIYGAMWIADKIGFAKPPAGATGLQLWGVATLCGIGFTMSLFIGALAFPRDPLLVEEAKLGVLLGSLFSALLGYGILRFAPQLTSEDDEGDDETEPHSVTA